MKRRFSMIILVLVLSSSLLCPAHAQAGDSKDELIDGFFALIDNGKYEEAFSYVFPETKWVDPASDKFRPLKNDMLAFGSSVGSYQEHIMMLESGLPDQFVVRQYYVAFERQPVRFQFQLYNLGGNWEIHGINYNYDLAADLDLLSLEELKKVLVERK